MSYSLDCRDRHDLLCRDADGVTLENSHEIVTSEVSVSYLDPHLVIEGRFLAISASRQVGHFKRWLDSDHRGVSVKHCNIWIEKDYRRTGIARAHYRAALPFYVEIGVKRVYLQANELGPYVWPAFAFEFEHQEWGLMLEALDRYFQIRYDSEVPFWPSSADELLQMTGPDGESIGYYIVSEVHSGFGGALSMELDLTDEARKTVLKDEGLI